MNHKIFQNLRNALKQNDSGLVEQEIRKLSANPQAAHSNELTKAKHWLASTAILKKDYALAQEMYKPFENQLPLLQSLALPKLSEADFQKALSEIPNWPELSLTLGFHYWRQGDFHKTIQVLAALIEPDVDSIFSHTANELYCDSLMRCGGNKNLNEIERLCLALATPQQQYRYPFIYLGYVKFTRRLSKINKSNPLTKLLFSRQEPTNNLFNEAMTLFEDAARRPQGLIPISCGCLSIVNPDSLSEPYCSDSELNIEAISYHTNNNYQTDCQAVVFFACDSVYLQQFALLLVASVAQLNTSALCHVHVVDPAEESFAVIAEIRQLVPQIQLNVSFEHLNSSQKKPYYASARFIRAIELLDLYKAPLFIVDTDMVIEISIPELMKLTDGYDIGLFLKVGSSPFPWNEVQAGVSYFTNSPNSRRFLELTKHTLLSKLGQAGTEPIWYIDQNVLFAVYWFLRNELSVCNLSSPQQPLFSCYSRTVSRRQFTAAKLSEFGINQSLQKSAEQPASISVTTSANELSKEAVAAANLAEAIVLATEWFEKEGNSEAAQQQVAAILPKWRRLRRLLVQKQLIGK